jgi:hypothetical protein
MLLLPMPMVDPLIERAALESIKMVTLLLPVLLSGVCTPDVLAE